MTTMLEARAAYFEANGFGEDGGYASPTVTVTVFGIPVSFPNTEGRKRAVVFHDMHHVLTGYRTNNLGEAEIGAWELGSGCWSFKAAWVLNTASLWLGVFTNPGRLFRAFVRGRRTENLYGRDARALLPREVDELQRELGLDAAPHPATLTDLLLFTAQLCLTFTAAAVPLALIGWAIAALW